MLWNVAAPFFRHDAVWIDDFVADPAFTFHKIGPEDSRPDNWHVRGTRRTPVGAWRGHWRQAGVALRGAEGLVTVFPQLAATANFRRRTMGPGIPMVAWCFNVGRFPGGAKRTLIRQTLKGIERVVVHARAEVPLVAELIGARDDTTVQFVPLQKSPVPVLAEQDETMPFIVAMGSANRDYATLIEAARLSRLPLTVVASPRAIAGLSLPENVTVMSGLSPEQCWRLAQRARFSVVPLSDTRAASGQVTVIEAMRMHRAVIATRSIGTEDYITDGSTGLLVPPADPAALAERMALLWDDHAERTRLADNGALFAEENLSDPIAAKTLVRILREAKAAHNSR